MSLASRSIDRPKIFRFAGDTLRLARWLVNPDTDAPFNPTGQILLFTLKDDLSKPDDQALIQKLSTIGGFTVIDAEAGSIELELVPADIAALVPGTKYECDIQAQDASTHAVKTVDRFSLQLTQDVTRLLVLSIPTTTTNPEAGYTWENIPDRPAALNVLPGTANGVATLDPSARLKVEQMPLLDDVGLGNVDDTSDADKPVSAAQAAADAEVAADAATALSAHTTRVDNPHAVTKGQVGLGSVTNDAQVKRTEMGAPSGVATLDSGGKVPSAQIPDLAISDYLGTAANQAAMLLLVGQKGDWCNRTDTGTVFVISGSDPAQLSSWTQLNYPTAPVTSVAGKTGAVALVKGDVGLGNVDNTSDANKPVSTAQQTALNLKADLASPALTGTPTAPTAATGDATTKLATTAFAKATADAIFTSAGPTNISAVLNVNLAFATGQRDLVERVSVAAGSGPYTSTLTLQNTNAIAGAIMDLLVSMPASFNPVIEIRNLTSGGTLLGAIIGNTVARVWFARVRFDGTNWFLLEFGQQRAASIAEVADQHNALAPRGGLGFVGTSNSRVYSTLTGQSIGTDDFSLSFVLEVPKSNPASVIGIGYLGSSATTYAATGGVSVNIDGNGTLSVNFTDGTNFHSKQVGGFVSLYAGKRVHLVVTRAGTTIAIYVNGLVLIATDFGTTPAYSQSITSTYFGVGYDTPSEVFTRSIYSASVFNFALGAADIQEIYELGGAIPERFKFGSQTALYSSDFSAGIDGWTNNSDVAGTPAGNIDGISGQDNWLRVENDTGSAGVLGLAKSGGPVVLASGKKYSIALTFFVDGAVADMPFVVIANTGTAPGSLAAEFKNVVATTPGTPQTIVSVLTGQGFGMQVRSTMNSGGTGAPMAPSEAFYVRGVTIKQLGAVVHLPLDDGLGYELMDLSPNRLHGVMSSAGVSHLLPRLGPARVRSTTNTNGNQQLFGGVVLPANSQILRVRARTQTNTPTVTLGTASGGAQVVASVALSTNWKDLTIALTSGLVGGSAASLWVGSNSTDVVEWDISWEPLSL